MVIIHSYYGSRPMKRPYFSGLFTSILTQLFWGEQKGYKVLTHCHIVEIQMNFDSCWSLFGFLLDMFGFLLELFGSFWSDCHWSLAFFLEILCRDGEIKKNQRNCCWVLELRFRCLNGDMFFLWYLFRMGLFFLLVLGESRHGFHMASPRPEPLN